MQNITGKTALITGGSKGIGYGIAAELLKAGMNVAITSRSQKNAEDAAAELSPLAPKGGTPACIIGIQSDVRDMEAEKNAVAKTIETFGQLDVLIANAGVGHFAPITELTAGQWAQTIDINLTGVFNSVKAGIGALIDSKGYLITIASLAGTNFFAKGAAYNASKFGLVGFTQAVMLDVRQKGVKVTTIMPGSVSSHFNGRTPGEGDAWKIQPDDLGHIVVGLLQMHPRTLPSKVEVRPAMPPAK